MPEAGRLLAGRYLLERLVAEGGMGEIWAARHQGLGVTVAVKRIKRESLGNSTLRARFEREAQVGARLRTPHVVQVFDYGEEDDAPFLVMELLDGEDFAEFGAQNKPFSLAQTVVLLSQAARGLAAAHAEGVVHRDVKPSNLFLARLSAGQEIVKVLDFGIAKLSEHEKLTHANVVLGSPSFMSPEQVRAGEVGPRTDVWGLGVVAFWMLSGELPFRAPAGASVADRIMSSDRPSLSDICRGLPDEVDDVFERALAIDPEDRYASPVDMMEALSRIDRAYPDLERAIPVADIATDRHPRATEAPDETTEKVEPAALTELRQEQDADLEPYSTATAALQTLKRSPAATMRMAPQTKPRVSALGSTHPLTPPPAEAVLKTRKLEPPRVTALAETKVDAPVERTTDRRRPRRASASMLWWLVPLAVLAVGAVLFKLLAAP